ncbi:MAG: hypothetical protein E2P02_01010 [Acidobacteria bacterium]|nr:MAG: hypothetical protein E2P02_01010 [Acidobacteriota bacterium]
MQAVLLAAGRSTRTYPLTRTRPKPLIPIWDRPLLEHQLGQLAGLVDEAILVVGYRHEQIESHFGSEYRGIRLRYAEQRTQRGTADAVLTARPYISERSLVLNGDDFYHHADLKALLEGGRGLLVTQAPDPQNRAVVRCELDAVIDIVEKPPNPEPGALCSVGGYCIEYDDLNLLDDLPLSPRGELELPDFILRLVRDSKVRPQAITQWWLPLTYGWDVLTAIRHIWADPQRAKDLGIAETRHEASRARTDDFDFDFVSFGKDVRLEGPIRLGNGVRLGDGVLLVGPTTIGAGCSVGDGARVEGSALFDNVHIGEGATVLDSVLGEGVEIGKGAKLSSASGRELTIDVKGKRVHPELDRLGAVVGDGARVSNGSVVEAGSLIDAGSG